MEGVLAQENVALQQLLGALRCGPPHTPSPKPSLTRVPTAPGAEAPPTLLCWVLIDPNNGHDFCSRFDFDTSPLLTCAQTVPAAWAQTLSRRVRCAG